MSELPAVRWPVDYDCLQRGVYLPPEVIEKATLTSRHDVKAYALASLRFRTQIIDFFREVRRDFVVVVSQGDGLRILDHAEQADYAPKRESHGIRQIRRAHAEGTAVDVLKLTEAQRERHDRWLSRNTFRLQQLAKQPPLALPSEIDEDNEAADDVADEILG